MRIKILGKQNAEIPFISAHNLQVLAEVGGIKFLVVVGDYLDDLNRRQYTNVLWQESLGLIATTKSNLMLEILDAALDANAPNFNFNEALKLMGCKGY